MMTRHKRFAALAALLPLAMLVLLLLTPGCRKPSTLETQHDDTQLPGVPNFSKVRDGLYRGAQPTDTGYQSLKDMGIRTIVGLRVLKHHSDELTEAGFRTYHISVKHIHPETEDVLEFLIIVTNPENSPVFVHCREGVDRTGMMVAIYRMVVQDWPKTKAIDEMKRMGFHDWNKMIERYLKKVDVEKLRQELAENQLKEISSQ